MLMIISVCHLSRHRMREINQKVHKRAILSSSLHILNKREH